MEMTAGDLRVSVSPDDGGRIASIVHGGRELLVTRQPGLFGWGCFPMIPWAGRIRRGRFSFAGRDYEVPVNFEPHAIHGVTFDRPWEVEGDDTIAIDLDGRWPFGGHALQRFEVSPGALVCTIEVHAGARSMPAQAGWHPWFVRPVALRFDAGSMYLRDGDGIPTGELVPPPPGPWDDCFTDLAGPPRLAWPDGSSLEMDATVDHWVVFDRLEGALCVEPQSGPPDGFTIRPAVVEPGAPLVVSTRWTFGAPF